VQEANGELTMGGYDEDRIEGGITWVDLLMPTCKSILVLGIPEVILSFNFF
jgi:hypothetical protein